MPFKFVFKRFYTYYLMFMLARKVFKFIQAYRKDRQRKFVESSTQ